MRILGRAVTVRPGKVANRNGGSARGIELLPVDQTLQEHLLWLAVIHPDRAADLLLCSSQQGLCDPLPVNSPQKLARFGGLLFARVMKYLPTMESDDEFRRLLDSFIEEMRNQDERSFGFRELRAYLRASIEDDTLTAEQEAAVFKHFGDHYDLRRWPFSESRWSIIDG